MSAPRTYQSAWQANADGTAVLLSAEDWLEEEAGVYALITKDDEDDDDRAGIMRAIAKEIATLRRERSQWAEHCTRLIGERAVSSPLSPPCPSPARPRR